MEIEIEGKFVDQENGITTITGTVEEILDQIDQGTILEYFDDFDIRSEYEDRDLGGRPEPMDTEGMIDKLEEDGYEVTWLGEVQENLDYKDQQMLDTIIEKFKTASWQEREEIYNKIVR